MKHKKILYVGISILAAFIILAGIYLGMAWYYADRFCYGTWINDIYCTGKTVEEVNQELILDAPYDSIAVIDRNQQKYVLMLSEIDCRMDYTVSLQQIKAKQSSLEWLKFYFSQENHEIAPEVYFSDEKMRTLLMTADFMNTEVYSETNKAEIVLGQEGYRLEDHTINQIVPEQVCVTVSQAIKQRQSEIYIEEAEGCYISLSQSRETKETYRLWEEISAFQDFKLTYLLGDRKEYIDESVVCGWIAMDAETGEYARDEAGNLVLDEEKVMEYVIQLGEKYDTYGKPREFSSTRGDLITIEKSTYGNDIDEKKECELLIEDFKENRSNSEREPVYAKKAWSQNEDDIGGTYIEVDMTKQTLYYYSEYELLLETSVVTGNMRRGWDTPAVVCSIYGKARNRILRGATYATFVYYWMPVYGNIGLHDATWRKSFGEDIYMTDGSHGCINMPKDKAAELYGMVEMGTPVILFY